MPKGAWSATTSAADILMYTKVFRSIYDGTLADNWQAMVTFQQMLILADSQGVVDMTPSAMARITGIPIEILTAGLSVLEAPDAGSRTPEMEGRRIARLDTHREWGWFLVNFAKYRAMQTREEKNEADRERMRAKRVADRSNVSQGVACRSNVSPTVASVADVAHTDLDLDLKQQKKELPPSAGGNPPTEPIQPEAPKPPADVPEPDPIFGVGLAFLLTKGVPKNSARSFLGLFRKECGSDLVASELLTRAEQDDITDPVAWLTRAAKVRKANGPQLSLVPIQPEVIKTSHRPLKHEPRTRG